MYLKFFISLLICNNIIARTNIVQQYIDEINAKKKFEMYIIFIYEGKNIIYNTQTQKFNQGNILKLPEIIINVNNNKSGKILCHINNKLLYEDEQFILETQNKDKIIGRKKSISFLKKTYELSEFLGVYILMQEKLTLDLVKYDVFTEGNKTTIIFYDKKISGNISNFLIIYLDNNQITHMLFAIDGHYKLVKVNNLTI